MRGFDATNSVQRSIVVFFNPFVKFVAIKIKIGSISVCSQTSGRIGLIPEMHRSRRATHPSHDGPVVRNPGRWGFSVTLAWKDHVMGSESHVSPPRSKFRGFCNSLAGMIFIGLAVVFVLFIPVLIYRQHTSSETSVVSSGPADPEPPAPPTQAPVKTESKQQQTPAVDQFTPSLEQPATAHNTESTNELAQSSNLSEREQIDLALKFRLLGRPAEQEKVLRNPRSPEAKVMRALMIQEDSAELRGSGMTTFDRSEAEKLATEALPKLSADPESKTLSMYLLSNLYRSGLGVPKDLHQAFRLSSEAASNGEKAAYRGLSWAYFLGDEVGKDEAKSLEWARKAADAGDTVMILRLSSDYEDGKVLKRSLAASMYYLEKAAKAGNPEAMWRYSQHLAHPPIYTYSEDTRKSMREESVDWLVKSAEAGNLMAMGFLSVEYEGGAMLSGVRSDRTKAFEWSKKAAASGLPFAIARLSGLYRFGVGCKQNEEEADSLLEQAKKAAKGDEKMISSVEMWSRSSPFEALASSPPSGSSEPKDEEIAKSPPKQESSTPRRKAARSKTTPINRETPSGTKLILLDLAISPALEGKVMHIDGRVKNISDEPIKDVRVNVSLETAGGKLLGTTRGFASPDPIPPGATATFQAREYDNLSFGHVTLDFVEHGDNAIPWHDQTGMKVHP